MASTALGFFRWTVDVVFTWRVMKWGGVYAAGVLARRPAAINFWCSFAKPSTIPSTSPIDAQSPSPPSRDPPFRLWCETMVSPQVVRRWLMTGGITAVTVTGALYGAGLKTKQEYKQVCLHSVA